MASLQKYAVLYAYINGRLLTEEAEVTINRQNNSNPVKTVAKGFAGVSDGAADMEITFNNVVPAADFEYDGGAAMLNNQVVEFCIQGPGGKNLVSKGFIVSDTLTHGVGREATLSFRAMCQYSEWK